MDKGKLNEYTRNLFVWTIKFYTGERLMKARHWNKINETSGKHEPRTTQTDVLYRPDWESAPPKSTPSMCCN